MPRLLLLAPRSITQIGNSLNSLAALATYVEKDCEVMVLGPSQDLQNILNEFKPDIVGITSYTYTYSKAVRTMEAVKQIRPGAMRIIGGVHITTAPWSLDPVFHAGVLGDGEVPLGQIIAGHDLAGIDGICLPDGTINPPKPVDVSTLPVPKLDIYTPDSYSNGIVGLFTSRGCPYNCVFCYSKLMRPDHQNYPVKMVVDNFQYAIEKLGANYLMLWDDCIFDAGRVHEMADEMDRRKLPKVKFSVNVAGKTMSRELAEAFQRLGVVSWNTGFESGSDRMLAQIKGRGAGVEKNKQLVALAHEFDVDLHGSFILGMPGETLEDMNSTLEFMEFLIAEKEAGRHRGGFWWFTATPFPGTPWWDIALQRGTVSGEMNFSKLNFNNWQDSFLLDDSVSELDWKNIVKSANKIIARSKIISVSLP